MLAPRTVGSDTASACIDTNSAAPRRCAQPTRSSSGMNTSRPRVSATRNAAVGLQLALSSFAAANATCFS